MSFVHFPINMYKPLCNFQHKLINSQWIAIKSQSKKVLTLILNLDYDLGLEVKFRVKKYSFDCEAQNVLDEGVDQIGMAFKRQALHLLLGSVLPRTLRSEFGFSPLTNTELSWVLAELSWEQDFTEWLGEGAVPALPLPHLSFIEPLSGGSGDTPPFTRHESHHTSAHLNSKHHDI